MTIRVHEAPSNPPSRRPLTSGRNVTTIGAALLVIVVGVLIAVLASPTIGWIVLAVGVVGLIVAQLPETAAAPVSDRRIGSRPILSTPQGAGP
jgi:hypothetical protein